jgi:effector-binding domain-containing protein
MDYNVEIKKLDSVRVAYMTHKGNVTEDGPLFSAIFQSIDSKINGTPFCIYHEIDVKTMQGIMDICVPTMEESNNPSVKIKTVLGIKALIARHIGTYNTIYMAFQAIAQYAAEHRIKLGTPSREIFIKGPNMEENPAKYITDVVIPIL